MLGIRHEEYEDFCNGLPFVLNADIKRNRYNLSKETNWHENLEIQFCQEGKGVVLLDGQKHNFFKGDIAIANTNVIHYTGTNEQLVYDALIISTSFCKQMGFDLTTIYFEPLLQNCDISNSFVKLKNIYNDLSTPQRTAKLNQLLLDILITLSQNYCNKANNPTHKNKGYERTKQAILYIRNNYQQKISLEQISKAVFCDKYTLCKDFKKFTGQTVFENLTRYRCQKATEYLSNGRTVSETASLCGFDNFSFFTKTFKNYIGKLPTEYKKQASL